MTRHIAFNVCLQIVVFALLLTTSCSSKSVASCSGQGETGSTQGAQIPYQAASLSGATGILSPSSDLDEIMEFADKMQPQRWGFGDSEFLFEEFIILARDVARLFGEKVETIDDLRDAGWLPFEPLGVIKDFSIRESRIKPIRFTGLEPDWEVAVQKKLIINAYSTLIPLNVRFSSRAEIEMVYGSIVPQFFVNPLNGEPMEFVFGEMRSVVEPPFVGAGSPITGVGPIGIRVRCFLEPLVDDSGGDSL